MCIFTTEERLRKVTLKTQNVDNLVFEDVLYINHRQAKYSNSLDPFRSKAAAYGFEKEFRSIAWKNDATPLQHNINNLHGITTDEIHLNSFIDKIVISPFSDSWYADSIRSICAQYGVNVQVIESSLKSGRIDDFYQALESLNEEGFTERR